MAADRRGPGRPGHGRGRRGGGHGAAVDARGRRGHGVRADPLRGVEPDGVDVRVAGVAAACARRVDPMVGESACLGPAGGRAGRVGPGRVPGPGGRGVRRGGGRHPVPWGLLPVRPGTPAGDRGARVEGRGVDVEHGCVEIVACGRFERSDRPSGGHAGSGRAQGDRAPAAGSRARSGPARRWRVAGVDAPRHGGIVGPAGGHDPVGERELRVRDLRRGPAQGRGPRPGPAHGTRSGWATW